LGTTALFGQNDTVDRQVTADGRFESLVRVVFEDHSNGVVNCERLIDIRLDSGSMPVQQPVPSDLCRWQFHGGVVSSARICQRMDVAA
jgi:hypothetical protein